MKNNFFTIAIPCYKVNNEFFKECIQSIINQNYEYFECLILISDDTLELNLVPKDNRFKVIKCEQHSTGYKRNVAIKNANGQFIVFVDCDDCIDKNYLNYSNSFLEGNDVDIIYYKTTKDKSLINLDKTIDFKILTGKETLDYWIAKMLSIDDSINPQWLFSGNPAKVYKRDFLLNNSIYLNEDFGLIGEDKIFNFKCATFLPKTAYSDYLCYWWRINAESFYRKKGSRSSLKWLDSYLKYIEEIFKNQQGYFDFVEKAKYQFIFYWIPKYSRMNNFGKMYGFLDTRKLIKTSICKNTVLSKFYKASKFKNKYINNKSKKILYFLSILFIKLKFYFLLNILLRLYTKISYKKANKRGK